MAFWRTAMVRTYLDIKGSCAFAYKRCIHGIAQPPPLHSPISRSAVAPELTLPEIERNVEPIHFGFGSGFNIGTGSMELMAVPKRKTSPHKRGIRNGPKALKPIPVIIRCTVCGRVKLPHYFCCSGLRDGKPWKGSFRRKKAFR